MKDLFHFNIDNGVAEKVTKILVILETFAAPL